MHLRVPSRPDWVEAIVTLLASQARAAGVADERGIGRLVVAMTEGITNAIVHGNLGIASSLKNTPSEFTRVLAERSTNTSFVGRVVDVRFEREPGRFVWTITDEGDGFDVTAVLHQLDEEQPDDAQPSGRGIAIMQAFVDSVSWSDGGRRLQLAINTVEQPEQRLNARQKYTAAVGVRLLDASFRHEAIARDLSATGLACVASQAFAVGAEVSITLDLDLPTQRSVAGKIVRCQAVSGGKFDLGIRFADSPGK